MTVGLADACPEGDTGVMRTYVEMVRKAGHFPLVLPATTDREEIRRQLHAIDALILVGGGDIAAARYGAETLPTDGVPNELRDAYELLLMEVVVEMKKPTLGICRGLQLINIFFGGSLCQDLPSQWKDPIEHNRPDKKWEPVHEVCIDSQSSLSHKLNATHIGVNSTHHQAVAELGKGLKAVAWSPDGVIEAIESELYPITAVQFHPERLPWGHLLLVPFLID